MISTIISKFAERISKREAEIAAEFSPKIRNHLVQMFRKAYAVEPTLTGVESSMGAATATGDYTVSENGQIWARQAHDWSSTQIAKALHPEVAEFLSEVAAYDAHLFDLPYIDRITVFDLVADKKSK